MFAIQTQADPNPKAMQKSIEEDTAETSWSLGLSDSWGSVGAQDSSHVSLVC